jgi:hypothetical protein
MKTSISLTIAIAIAASTVVSRGQDDSEQVEFPKITRQPIDEAVPAGGRHVLSVEADDADSFQWYRNGEALHGQTNKDLVLENVAVKDVGNYQCNVAKNGEAVPTRSASLNVFTMSGGGGGPITVFGTPVAGSGGQSGGCPGQYVGYVIYVKPSPAWGWVPTAGTSLHTATDTNRTDTWVVYTGRYGTDNGCAQTTVTIPHPPANPKYRFAVYFPNNLPTNAYPIQLVGFDP